MVAGMANTENLLIGLQQILQEQTRAHESQLNVLMQALKREEASPNIIREAGIQKLNIPNFSGHYNEDIRSWLFIAEQIMSTANINYGKRCQVISGYLRDSALQWFRKCYEETPILTWDEFKTKLLMAFEPPNLQTRLRMSLDRLKQGHNLQTYILKFMTIMNQTKDMTETDKVHTFVRGLAPKTRAEVGYQSPRTLEEAIRIASGYDSNFFHQKDIDPKDSIEKGPRQIENNKMDICMGQTIRNKTQRNRPMICYNCNRRGHKASECRAQKSEKKVTYRATIKNDEKYLQNQIIGTINNHKVSCILDTGACRSIMSRKLAERLKITPNPENIAIHTAEGRVSKILGTTGMLEIEILGKLCNINFIITRMETPDLLIGLDWFNITKAIYCPSNHQITFKTSNKDKYASNYDEVEDQFFLELGSTEEGEIFDEQTWDQEGIPEIENNELKPIVGHYLELFTTNIEKLEECKILKHKIRVEDVAPISLPPYRKSVKEIQTMKEEVDKMLAAKIIKPSISPWSFPVVMVPKKDGTWRFCVDYRRLNTITITDKFPLPRIDDILDNLSKSRIYSKLDLKCGYWQIPLENESMKYTAFSTPFGHYEYTRLPFGIKNAPSEFSRIMAIVFRGLSFVEVYIDDIIIHSVDISSHKEHLKEVLERVKQAKLKLNGTKCQFGKSEINILGYTIAGIDVKMDEEKIKAIRNLAKPSNIKELQIFLGLTGYYRKFIEGYAKIAAPLFQLLKKEEKFSWNEEVNEAWEKLKQSLISFPILKQPDFEKPFILYTDASGVAIGAILAQVDNTGKEHVIAYSSRILSSLECHYGISEKECLAVVWGIRQFRIYLSISKFKVVTDHAALKWLLTLKDVSGRLARWSIYLQSYDYEVLHRAGKIHTNADALTRLIASSAIIETREENSDPSSKILDPWQDDILLNYLLTDHLPPGISKNHKMRLEKQKRIMTFDGQKIYIVKGILKREIPKPKDRQDIIIKEHLLGHFGTQTVYSQMCGKYYWKKMLDDVSKIVKNCEICIRHDNKGMKEHKSLSLPITNINDRIGIDLVFGLPISTKGYSGIMVITEYLTKFPEAYPIKSKNSQEIAKNILNYISKYGPPKEILTDQGKEFTNKLIQELCKLNGIEHKLTSVYHPRTNGLTERFNQTLIQILSKNTEENPSTWDDWIPFALWVYRRRIHSSTGYSPFELMYGRKMNELHEVQKIKGGEVQEDEKSYLERRLKEIKKLLETTIPQAKAKITKCQKIQCDTRDKKNKKKLIPPLEKGQVVFIKVPGLLNKLQPKFTGPYIVSHRTPKGNYWLKNKKGDILPKSFPITKLKKTQSYLNSDIIHEQIRPKRKILAHKRINDKLHYYIKDLVGTGETDGWINEENLNDDIIYDEYWKSLTGPQSSDLTRTAESLEGGTC